MPWQLQKWPKPSKINLEFQMAYRVSLPFIFLFWLFAVSGCQPPVFHVGTESYKTVHRLGQHEFPEFTDDMDLASLIECSRHHLSYLAGHNSSEVNTIGMDSYSTGWLRYSIEIFLQKLETNPSPAELTRFLSDNYLIYQAGGREDQSGRRMLVTGYYEPVFAGSLTRQPPFLTAIYAPPPTLITVFKTNGEITTGRYNQDQQLISFWSRKEIEATPELLQGC